MADMEQHHEELIAKASVIGIGLIVVLVVIGSLTWHTIVQAQNMRDSPPQCISAKVVTENEYKDTRLCQR